MKNLAHNPEFKELKEKLKQQLRQLIEEVDDDSVNAPALMSQK